MIRTICLGIVLLGCGTLGDIAFRVRREGDVALVVKEGCCVGCRHDRDVSRAVDALRRGEAVVFPTDTVYGVGVAVRFAQSPERLFKLKRRDEGKPVAWLIGSFDDLERYAVDVPEYAVSLAKAFWPGALTLVVKASDRVPAAFRSKEGTIGLRMPASDVALELARAVSSPLATTSANFSGEPAPRSYEELDPAFSSQAASVLADGSAESGVASTVLDCRGERPACIREGSIGKADVDAALLAARPRGL